MGLYSVLYSGITINTAEIDQMDEKGVSLHTAYETFEKSNDNL